MQLVSERERGNIAYIDVAALQLNSSRQTEPAKELAASLKKHVSEGALVVFDDFSGLLHSGLPALEALKLFRKMQAISRRVCVSQLSFSDSRADATVTVGLFGDYRIPR